MTTPAMPLLAPGAIGRDRRAADADTVARILERVKREGDAAVHAYARAFGDPVPRRVPAAEVNAAPSRIPAPLRSALERTMERVTRFAGSQLSALSTFSYESDGLRMGQRIVPIASAGLYIPAGRHPLPSTAIMTVVPARAAGCARIAVCTPNAVDATLAVCALAGVDEVYELGGAQAIGALAYGTASIAPVDKIFGPGNAYVSEAKRQVAGICGVDLPAGPSEVAVIASADADPADAARSLLAEAEHDVDARAYLLTDSAAFAAAVDAAIVRLASGLATRDVALAAIGSSGAIVCDSLDACVRCADAMAIEHVELLGPAAASLSDRLRSYGAVFVGLPSAFGDYGAGPNHTLPTQSSARYAAGLSVYDFVSVRPFIERVAAIDARLIGDCMTLARMEGLPAHEAALAAAITSPR